jgi:hypothetical protein
LVVLGALVTFGGQTLEVRVMQPFREIHGGSSRAGSALGAPAAMGELFGGSCCCLG